MNDLTYIDNDIDKGIVYDYPHLIKEYKKLKIPKTFHTPVNYPFDKCKFFVDVSERSIGKTTNWLLWGMMMNKEFGTVIAYVRQTDNMLMPKNLDIFSTILENGYIDKLTNGKYTSIYYHGRKWYYCNYDDNGKVAERSNDYFMIGLSIDRSQVYKSGLSIPTADCIIFDEFCSRYYNPNEFVDFLDLVKTLQRNRISPFIVMLSNTIDKHNEYFSELEAYELIQTMSIGDSVVYNTSRGTCIQLSIVAPSNQAKIKKSITNALFYGFKNPRLSSITGDDWSFINYPHSKLTDINERLRGVYIEYNSQLVGVDICLSETLGIVVVCHKANKTYDDSIIFTKDDTGIYDSRYRYLMTGKDRLEKLILKCYHENKFYYQNNQIGAIVSNFFKANNKLKGMIR